MAFSAAIFSVFTFFSSSLQHAVYQFAFGILLFKTGMNVLVVTLSRQCGVKHLGVASCMRLRGSDACCSSDNHKSHWKLT